MGAIMYRTVLRCQPPNISDWQQHNLRVFILRHFHYALTIQILAKQPRH